MICNKYILVISLISFINLYALIQFIKNLEKNIPQIFIDNNYDIIRNTS